MIIPGGGSVFAAVGDAHRSTRLRLMNEANAVHRLAPVAHGGLGDDTAAALVGMVDEVIAVWDGASGTAPARVAELARRAGLYVHRIWPDGCEPPA